MLKFAAKLRQERHRQQQQQKIRNQMDETQLNETLDTSSHNLTAVKRTASITSPRSSAAAAADHDPQIYENVEAKKAAAATESMSTQTEAKSPLQANPAMQREESFVRTGSGRKLPKIPTGKPAPAAGQLGHGTLPVARNASATEAEREAKAENRKSKPKALEFWESLETMDDPAGAGQQQQEGSADDFRYNTIHRMSMGRRMLPKAPVAAGAGVSSLPPAAHRSQSLDRNGDLAAAFSHGGDVFNSSFSSSGPTSLPNGVQSPPVPRGRPSVRSRAKLDSESSGAASPSASPNPRGPSAVAAASKAEPSQPSPPSSSGSRGEVEGSSDNNSPPTSVIQGQQAAAVCTSDEDDKPSPLRRAGAGGNNPALDWLRGSTFGGGSGNSGALEKDKLKSGLANGFHHPNTLEEDILRSGLSRAGDGNSSSSKQSDSMSDSGGGGGKSNGHVPYEVLLQDLTQAKRQLLELHNLVSANLDFFRFPPSPFPLLCAFSHRSR